MSGYSIKSNSDDMPVVASNPWGHALREKDCPQWIENAEYIVRCVNSHALLVEALKIARDALKSNEDIAGTWELYQQSPEMKTINAALASAQPTEE